MIVSLLEGSSYRLNDDHRVNIPWEVIFMLAANDAFEILAFYNDSKGLQL